MVVSSAEGAREVLKTQDIHLANRPELVAPTALFYNNSGIAFARYGEQWRELKKMATLVLFTAKRVQSFREIREEEASKLIKSIASEAASGSVVNLSDKLFSFIFNVASRIVCKKEGEDQETFRVVVTNLLDAISASYIADLYPSIKWLDSISGLRSKLNEMVKDSDRLLDPIIEEHISKKKQGKAMESLVDDLLKLHNGNLADGTDHSFSLTFSNIKAVILEIFTAGSETSLSVTEWAMSELLRNPKLMERAQAEVRKVYKSKRMVDESSLHELNFLKLVIKETLRLHFVVPLLAPRECIEHCRIHGYDIPPKTRILVNAWAIARDPKYWTDPDLFLPERFEASSFDYKGNNFEFIPFGAGRRMCPGVALGIVDIELPLAALLYHFDWKLAVGLRPEDLDMEEVCGLTVQRKNPLHAIAIPYI